MKRWTELFFGLPAEIRNYIYEYLACDEDVILDPGYDHGPLIVSVSYSSKMNKQHHRIRDEYLSVAWLRARSVRTTVYDFNFFHVMACLQQLPLTTIQALASSTQSQKRRFIIEVRSSEQGHNAKMLDQWLDRLLERSQALDIDFEYVFTDTYYGLAIQHAERLLEHQIMYRSCIEAAFEAIIIKDSINKRPWMTEMSRSCYTKLRTWPGMRKENAELREDAVAAIIGCAWEELGANFRDAKSCMMDRNCGKI